MCGCVAGGGVVGSWRGALGGRLVGICCGGGWITEILPDRESGGEMNSKTGETASGSHVKILVDSLRSKAIKSYGFLAPPNLRMNDRITAFKAFNPVLPQQIVIAV